MKKFYSIMVLLTFLILCSLNVFGALTDGLRCHYNFDNNLLNDVDSTNATSDSSVYSTGKINMAHNLTAYTQYIRLCNLTNNANSTNWSVDFWSYSIYTGTNAVTLNQKNGNAVATDWFFYDYESDKKLCVGETGLSQQCSGTNVRNNSVWQYHYYEHLANGNTLIYINNVLVLNTSAPNVIKDLSKQWAYGFFDSTGSQGEVGLVDLLGMWNRTLTEAERNQRYNSGSGYDPFNVTSTSLSLTAKNSYNSSAINNFSALINGTLYNTTNGTIITDIPKNSTSLFNITYISLNFFNSTYLNVNVSTNHQGILNQSIINLFVKEFDSNNSISNFSINISNSIVLNTTNNNGTINPLTNNYTAIVIDNSRQEVYQSANTSFEVLPLDNKSVVLYVFEHSINISVKNIFTNATINNFSVYLSDLTDGTDTRVFNTTNGSIIIPVVHHIYNVTVDAYGFANYNNSAIFNISSNVNYTFYVYTTNSLDMYFYRYSDGSNMSGVNVTVNFIGLTAQENKTDTGRLYVDLFSPDTYTILFQADGYRQGKYIVDLTNRSYNRLDLYLENESLSNLILITVKDKFGKVLPNVEVLIQKWYNDGWVTDQIVATDFQGRAEAYYVLSTVYYNHILTYNNIAYFGSINNNANKKVIYAEDVNTGLNFNIDILGNSLLPSYQKTQDVYVNLSYVNVSNISGYFRFYFSDPDNQQRIGCLVVTNMSSNSDIYNSCSTTSTGTIISDTISVNNSIKYFRASAYIDGFTVANKIVRIGQRITSPGVDWGVTGYIVALLLCVIGFFGFIYSPTISLIVGTIIFIFLGIFGVIFGNLSGKDYGVFFILLVITFLIANIKSSSGVNR